jgi:predicted O-methyltransferase YrrM
MQIKLRDKLKKIIYKYKNRRYPKPLRIGLSIPTHMTQEELLLLYDIAGSLGMNKSIGEIGSYLGASSVCIAAGIDKSSRLYCIDTWQNDNMIYLQSDRSSSALNSQDTFKRFLKNVDCVLDRIVTIRAWSSDAVTYFETQNISLDMLFIDGDHEYSGVKSDWDNYNKILKPGSYVIFHDTGWAAGVIKLLEEIGDRLQPLSVLPNMRVFRFRQLT